MAPAKRFQQVVSRFMRKIRDCWFREDEMDRMTIAIFACWIGAISGFAAPRNLAPNGDFETPNAARSGPAFWEPLQAGRSWIDGGEGHGKIIRIDMPREVARGEGYWYISDKFPIEQDKTYRCAVEARSAGPSFLVFLTGYANLRYPDGEIREVRTYRKQIKSDKRIEIGKWTTLDFLFTPRRPATLSNQILQRRNITLSEADKLEIKLFCYGSEAGMVDFDNIVITEAPPDAVNPNDVGENSERLELLKKSQKEEYDAER